MFVFWSLEDFLLFFFIVWGFLFCFDLGAGIEPRALTMLRVHSAIELNPQCKTFLYYKPII
jgi:hypothetical protein